MAIQRETELSFPVKQFFEASGYEVKSEVNGCDLVAYREDLDHPVIIELKKTFSLPLLLQGVDRLKLSPSVYLAVEKKTGGRGRKKQKEWNGYVQLCKRLGLGLITVQFFKTIKPRLEICCDPGDHAGDRLNKRKTARLMKEFHARSGDYNVGGSTGRKLMTAYREQSLYCAYLADKHGVVSPKQLKELTGIDKVNSILQRNVYGWYERIERGKYVLTEAGKEALHTYDYVVRERFADD